MLTRIVKLSFEESNIDLFLEIFNSNKNNIRNFEGCRLLQLLKDKNNPNIIFSYSHWESEKHLDVYRNSDLFKSVWKKTKILFNNKPEAWSVENIELLD